MYQLVHDQHLQGSPDAPILFLEVIGPCHSCADLDRELAQLMRRLPDDVAIVRLRGPGNAPVYRTAMLAFPCAVNVGISFEYLYEVIDAPTTPIESLPSVQALRKDQRVFFESCRHREMSDSSLAAESRLLADWHIISSPALFINGIQVRLPVSEEELDSAAAATLGNMAPL